MKLRLPGSRLLWVLITLFVMLLIATPLIWSWSATREWQRVKAAIEAEGETFDLQKLLPPPPPDDDNFCAIPALKDIALVVDGDSEKGEPAAKRAALRELVLNKDHPDVAPPRHVAGPTAGAIFDFVGWSEFMTEVGLFSPADESTHPKDEMLSAIDRRFPLIVEIAAAADHRQAQFIPGPSQRSWPTPLFDHSALPSFDGCLALSNLLRLRAEAAVIVDNAKAAADSIIAIRHLGTACGHEPFLIGHLVAMASDTASRRALWSALERRTLDEAQLVRIQSHLHPPRSNARLLYVLRSEMCFYIDTIAFYHGAGRSKLAEPIGVEPVMPLWLARALPGGWVDYNGTVWLEMMWRTRIKTLRDGGLSGIVDGMRKEDAEMAGLRSQFTNRWMLALTLHEDGLDANVPAMGIAGVCGDQQGLIAIALERYFIRHQKYPATLQDLAPEFLPSPLIDGLTGKPLGYRKTDDGRYMIWSFGFDGVDDGGKVNPSSEDDFSNLHQLGYKGDWTWQYRPIMP